LAGIDRRVIQNFEWPLLSFALAISLVGIINLVSAGSAEGGGTTAPALRQLAWLGLGLVALFAALVPDYRSLERLAPSAYVAGIALLAAVLLFAPVVNGSQRWLALGPARLQPSELMKLILVLTYARFLSRRGSGTPLGFLDLIVPSLLLGAPVALIVQQPDLGTGMLLVLICGTLILMVSLRPHVMIVTGVGASASALLAWFFFLHDYQKDRILTFLEPERDPLGAAYHHIQSLIAVGSGGMFGKGFGEGLSQLGFLPEQQTDFVFSVLCEQWGFFGGALVLVLFACLIVRGFMVARVSKDPFGAYLALGIVGIFFWACAINVGMVLGVVPVVGVPLPFLSYGGSSLITCMLSIGLLMNISMRRYVF
jgi:rod shape determining protein RodA